MTLYLNPQWKRRGYTCNRRTPPIRVFEPYTLLKRLSKRERERDNISGRYYISGKTRSFNCKRQKLRRLFLEEKRARQLQVVQQRTTNTYIPTPKTLTVVIGVVASSPKPTSSTIHKLLSNIGLPFQRGSQCCDHRVQRSLPINVRDQMIQIQQTCWAGTAPCKSRHLNKNVCLRFYKCVMCIRARLCACVCVYVPYLCGWSTVWFCY